MDRYAASVHGMLEGMGASPDDAEDALQECFVAAWRRAEAFDGGPSARAWLFTIARNALRRQHRRRVGEPASFESLESLGAAAGWGAASDFSHRLDVHDELSWALDHLPDDERQAVVLRDLEGLSGAEAAQVLSISLPAVKSRLHRGRLRLMAVVRGGEG